MTDSAGSLAPPSPPAPSAPPDHGTVTPVIGPVEGPVWIAWCEATLTRAKELEALCAWVLKNSTQEHTGLASAVPRHLAAARQAAQARQPAKARQAARAAKAAPTNQAPTGQAPTGQAPTDPESTALESTELEWKKRFRILRNGPLLERAKSNLDAAEAEILNFAPPDYVLGLMPSLLNHVQCHLIPSDPRRQQFERIARKLGVKDPDHPALENKEPSRTDKLRIVCEDRGTIVTAVRAASSAALREQLRLRSFRNLVLATTFLMALLAIGLALTGFFRPTLIPLCFAPEEAGRATIVCPTEQSDSFPIEPAADSEEDIDVKIEQTVSRQDMIVVELVGLTAAAVAAAAAIRGIRGSSERHGLPVALIALKLPTGAITAFLGLLLMRGQFVPGLSALDTSAQILAWALVFGYAQQLFTRLVDRQGQTVLDSVRGADKAQPAPTPP